MGHEIVGKFGKCENFDAKNIDMINVVKMICTKCNNDIIYIIKDYCPFCGYIIIKCDNCKYEYVFGE